MSDRFLLYLTFMLTFILYLVVTAGVTYLLILIRATKTTKARPQPQEYYELSPEQVQAMFNMGRQKKEAPKQEGPQAAEFPPHAGLYL